jgi:hypothetical protein
LYFNSLKLRANTQVLFYDLHSVGSLLPEDQGQVNQMARLDFEAAESDAVAGLVAGRENYVEGAGRHIGMGNGGRLAADQR